ncbi:sodium:proton exchanger [Plantactinospora sp. KLBMP9567]|uniref:sodium:proton exchanger n=1 Tax=Plantactinospora sp. KLBMP9567 TaxID=3085900 RepID=UPI0029816BD2|nr:sodium:proton exchanger [Plantactinospora sp. KLBMP9567]MDW5330787.1 sodium:proton exchanger [Plantactinospora sp. KLBMP9567]
MRVGLDVTVSARGVATRVGFAVLAAVPAVAMRLAGVDLPAIAGMAIFGVAVLSAVALLMWASEVARVDLPGSLALALLALVAVLPEYAIDIYFAFAAGSDPEFAAFALANMTGANRLLIGVAWPLLVFAAIWAVRRRGQSGDPGGVSLSAHRRTETIYLLMATVYALVIPLTGRLAWYDSIVLGALFALYLSRIGRTEHAEEALVGVAATLARAPKRRRRLTVAVLFGTAAVVILSAAEPFGKSLVKAGTALGIDEFLLVQWLAPVASEAPEVIVAIAFALRGRADDGLGALLAAKLNQWTLLIACLPIAFYLGGGEFAGLPLDPRQTEELYLTSAQTLLGVAVLADLRISRVEAALLFLLFAVQFAVPTQAVRYGVAVVYAVLAGILLARHRRELPALVRASWPTGRARS